MLEVQAGRNTARQSLIDSASLPLDEALETLTSAETGDGWSTNGPLGGAGHTICVSEPSDLKLITSECQAILKACALKIQVATNAGPSLDAHRPEASAQWEFVASGFWYEDVHHSGHIAYYIANPAPGCWVMEASERNAILDDVTEEDVEEGLLNDDQMQAMWGQTLKGAQNAEYRHIVARSEGVEPDITAAEMTEHGVAAQDAVLEGVEADSYVRLGAGVSRGNQGRGVGGVDGFVHGGLPKIGLRSVAIR